MSQSQFAALSNVWCRAQPIWFDNGWHDMRFTRNVLINNLPDSNGIGFEMSNGPALVDNNIFVGTTTSAYDSGTGVTGMDASGVTYVHNLVLGYGSSASIYSLSGRTCGTWPNNTLPSADALAGSRLAGSITEPMMADRSMRRSHPNPNARTCAISNWTVEANMLLGLAKSPWAVMHTAKNGTRGEPLVAGDTLDFNVIRGRPVVFSSKKTHVGPRPPTVEIKGNQNVTGSAGFNATVDVDALTLTLTVDAAVGQTGCTPGGPGGEVDFTGAPRSSTKCTPGPIEGLVPGEARTISLAPVGP